MLPMIVLMLLQVSKNQQHVYIRTETENTAAVILSKIEYEINHAGKIITSSSTFDTDESVLVYRDSDDQLRRFEYATDTVEFSDTLHNIGRLRFFDGTNHWLTSENLAVTVFQVEPVRNGEALLTGLNIKITITPLSTDTVMDQANILELETSFEVFPSTIEF